MANSLSVNTKKILHAIGALVDGAYLWAGADKGIQTEMQGKNNGGRIYYTISDFGDAAISSISSNDPYSGSETALTANNITQRDVQVEIRDARIMISTTAFERMVTSAGEVEANLQIGQKLAKKAIKAIIPDDIASIRNVFVGTDYKPFQLAGAYLKSYTEGKLYGFMDWQAWGTLTAKGQQAVPCVLARPEFGKELVGKWSLIDELRVIPDIPTIDVVAMPSGLTATIASNILTISTSTAGAGVAAGKVAIVKVAGIKNTDTNGNTAGEAVFVLDNTSGSSAKASFTFSMVGLTGTAGAVSDVVSSTDTGTYAGCIIRAEKAQVFGSADKCACESAKYSKESYEGFNVHCNEESDVSNLTDYKRYDLVLASKLVEPRAAALVYIKL